MTLVKLIETDLGAMSPEALAEMLSTIGRRHRGGLNVAPVSEQPLGHRASTFVLPNMSLAISRNTPSHLKGGVDMEFGEQVAMTLCAQGTARVIFDRWDEVLVSGDGIFAWEGHGVDVGQPVATNTIYLQLPRALIEPQADLSGSAYVRAVRGGHPAMSLLRHYALALANHDLQNVTSSEFLETTTQHLCDLVALALGPNREGEHQARTAGVPAARLTLAKGIIARNLQNPQLDTDFLARELGVSTSYIRKLFEKEDVAVATYIRVERLKAAREHLRDVRYAHMRIIEIAGLYGFDDISTFNRAFRRQFGLAPGEVRYGK